jgi:purine-nucleoside phosphorylase
MSPPNFPEAVDRVRDAWPDFRPRVGMILGSGWGGVVKGFAVEDRIDYAAIPGLGAAGVAGHRGQLLRAHAGALDVMIFQGRRHWYEGEGWDPVAVPVYVLRALGASALLLTNAAGGIREGFRPGDLMMLDDHINCMHGNPLLGAHDPAWGARFPDQTAVYDPTLRAMLDAAAGAAGIPLHHGVYLAASGPTYETPAEVRAYRILGADAVGMSTVPEAMLANAVGIKVAAVSCISNLAAGMGHERLTHQDVTAATEAAMDRMRGLVMAFWQEYAHAQA